MYLPIVRTLYGKSIGYIYMFYLAGRIYIFCRLNTVNSLISCMCYHAWDGARDTVCMLDVGMLIAVVLTLHVDGSDRSITVTANTQLML